MNRKLIRPNLTELKEKLGHGPRTTPPADPVPQSTGAQAEASTGSPNAAGGAQAMGGARRKIAPPEQTNAENFYYLKQMQSMTPMVVVLQNDEKVRGVIEWYDKHCLKINRVKEPNILLPKHNIKYIYKQEEEPRIRRTKPAKKEDASAADLDNPAFD
jgi:sRNA-binding regulator protein Hfq